jgi:predicted alpha/beta hydrolase
LAPNRAYRNSGEFTLVIFDLRVPGAAARLHSERAAWREYADIEMLDFDHAVLIVRPGAARRAAK